MFTDTFDPSQVYKVYVVQSQRKSSLNQNHKFEKKQTIHSIISGAKCDSCDEDERRRCATAIIVKPWCKMKPLLW